jgi:protein-tyrosine phosphatase
MIDLHSHILPGLDDGAKTIEDSLAMAEDAISDGITHVVATPHASSEHVFDYRRVRAELQELRDKLSGRLTLASGCDFHVNHENVVALRKDPHPFCINQKNYLLVEFNDFSIPSTLDQTLHEICLAEIHPIITHPERNGILRTHSERLVKWINQGCYVQVTAGSLSGVFGPSPQQHAWRWLSKGMVHFVSSDAHNTTRRPMKLKFAYDAIAGQMGEERAKSLLVENPLAAFEGRQLPYVPEIAPGEEARKRKRFFFF